MIPVPVITPLIAAPAALVVRVMTRPVLGLRIVLRRSSHAPGLVVTIKARRGRVTLRRLRAATSYTLRARACLRRICGHWSRRVRITTLHTAELPRGASVASEPPMGALPRIGFNDSAYADNQPDAFYGDVHQLGGSIVRRIVSWSWLEPDGPTPDYTLARWRALDAFVARADTEGLGVTFEIGWAPAWARRYPLGAGKGGAPTLAAWRGFIDLLSARYPTVKRWGWNEPNCCTLESYVPTVELAGMLDAVYPLLHARIPGVDVMAGGWCPCGAGGETMSNGLRDLAAAEHRLRHRIFDTVAFHIYPAHFGRLNGWEAPSTGVDNFDTADFGAIVARLDALFARRVDFHVTETGWMTPGGYHGDALDAAAQARAAIAELGEARRYSDRISSFEWFLVRDQPSSTVTANVYKTGLRYADGSAKPLFDAWRDYVKAAA